jgi:hypothetical protein
MNMPLSFNLNLEAGWVDEWAERFLWPLGAFTRRTEANDSGFIRGRLETTSKAGEYGLWRKKPFNSLYADLPKVEIELERPRIIDGTSRNRRGIGV